MGVHIFAEKMYTKSRSSVRENPYISINIPKPINPDIIISSLTFNKKLLLIIQIGGLYPTGSER